MFILLIPFLFVLLVGTAVVVGAFSRWATSDGTLRLFGMYALYIGAYIRGAHKTEWLLLGSYQDGKPITIAPAATRR